MANVVLIFPQIKNLRMERPNLGVLYLSAMLLQNHFSVAIIDETVQDDARERLDKYITTDTICVGISALTGRQLWGALSVADYVRKKRPDLPLVWGGTHATGDPLGTLKHPLVDSICIGEGEVSFIKMVKAYQDGGALGDIPGIGYKENGKLILTKPRDSYFDLNSLPPLPYDLVDLNLYKKDATFLGTFGLESSKLLSLETSRGCPFRCTYCVQSVKQEQFRGMNAGTVLRYLEDIVKLGVRGVTIVDDNFFVNPKRAVEIMESVRKKNWNLEISVAVRSDYLVKIKDETLVLMKDFGVKLLSVGVESGSDRVLKQIINKKEQVQDAFLANEKLTKFGIYTYFNFIVGFPGERFSDIIETYRAMIRIMKKNPHAKVSNKKLIPLPGSLILEECVKGGMKRPETIEEWADIEDLRWKKRITYVERDAERWFQHTRYYDGLMMLLSSVRSPHDTYKRKILRACLTPPFIVFSWIVNLRARLRFPGFFIDNLIMDPPTLLVSWVLKLKYRIQNALHFS